MPRPKVLLVEDNHLVRWSVTQALEQQGFCVLAANSVEQAVAAAVAFPFDVLVTDWRLPDGHTGVELLDTVRCHHPQVSAVLITAELDAELLALARRAGFQHVLEKPFATEQIVQAITAPVGIGGDVVIH